ncbi:MAG: Fic family protein [Chlorobi bacterium]|nr:Fic family protein [Chlorobiota bacterium]
MKSPIYHFRWNPDWDFISRLNRLERFDARWEEIRKREAPRLHHLKHLATVQSVGASTRIEGARMTDEEIALFLKNLDVTKIQDRDSGEVAGYYEALETILAHYPHMPVTENQIKHLHHIMMQYSEKDGWHRGNYKTQPNRVEALLPDGSKRIIFETTPPGIQTQEAMRQLVEWYHRDTEVHPLVKTGAFVYEFLSIHPFQDGNGRLSRLMTIWLLLKSGYEWISYVSLEHEIENRKGEYYAVLRKTQAQRPNEDLTEWLTFFLGTLENLQLKLENKLQRDMVLRTLTPKENKVRGFIEAHPGTGSGEIAEKLSLSLSTVKRILKKLTEAGVIARYGKGKGTHYGPL